MWVSIRDIDVLTGIRANIEELREIAEEKRRNTTWRSLPKRTVRGLI